MRILIKAHGSESQLAQYVAYVIAEVNYLQAQQL